MRFTETSVIIYHLKRRNEPGDLGNSQRCCKHLKTQQIYMYFHMVCGRSLNFN